jgi:hypothetical protein
MTSALQVEAYGEVKAPAQIDTLRVRTCPVCSEEDSWDGDGRCRVCGYLPPPEPFRDPDLSVAQKADMREGPVNPDVFKAPPFIPPHEEEVDEEEDDPLDPAAPPSEFSPRIRDFGESTKVQGVRVAGKLKDALEELEKTMIKEGLRRTNWNKSRLAKELGISRAGLIMKVEKYGLDKRKLAREAA